jgi:hypothetical protein
MTFSANVRLYADRGRYNVKLIHMLFKLFTNQFSTLINFIIDSKIIKINPGITNI